MLNPNRRRLARVRPLAMAVAACATAGVILAGGVSAGLSSKTRASGPAGASAADLAYVKAQVRKFSAIPSFTPPGPAFDAKKAAGKHVFNIPFISANAFNQIFDSTMASVSKKYGITFTDFQNQGQPRQWVQGMAQARTKKADLINLMVTDPRALGPQIAQARGAGIDVVSTQHYDVTEIGRIAPGLTAAVPNGFTAAARLMADWAIWDTKGKAHIAIVMTREANFLVLMANAIKREVARRCGSSCTVTILNVPVATWATRMATSVQSAMVRNPSINYIIPLVDPMVQFVVPAITAAGKIGKVHIATLNGTPSVLKMIRDGDIVRMDIGQNIQWLAWTTMDQIMRVLTGVKPAKASPTVMRIWTKANVAQAGNPPTFNKGYGKAYVRGFTRLWSGRR